MDHDCCFIKENRWFRYRAAAIIIEEGCILFVGNQRENYLYSVGGGVHMGETAEEAVKREVYEETGVAYEIDRLAIIHENFFEGDGTLEGLQCHEVALYYLMKPRGTKELHSNSYTGGVREEMHWIPIEELDQYVAYPTFLKEKLGCIKEGIEHIVTHQESTCDTTK